MNSESLIIDKREENILPSFNHGYFQLSIGMALRQQENFSVVSSRRVSLRVIHTQKQ